MTKNQERARALLGDGDTREAYLAKLNAADVPYSVEVIRMLGEDEHGHRDGRVGRAHVSVFVQGEAIAISVEQS